jgi:hypothetical protein
MRLVKQEPGERTCGQCCVAMLAGISRAEAIGLVGTRGGTGSTALREALAVYGIELGRAVRFGHRTIAAMPPTAIVRSYRRRPQTKTYPSHWMVWHDGQMWCPDRGRFKVADWMEAIDRNRSDEWLSSYWPVMSPVKPGGYHPDRIRRVDQTRFGYPEGNCMSACAASVLGLAIGEVPNWAAEHQNTPAMWDAYVRWVWRQGYQVTLLRNTNRLSQLDGHAILDGWPETWPVLLGGTSPRAPEDNPYHHKVVGRCTPRGFETIHDPHPDRDGLLDIQDVELWLPRQSVDRG